MAMMASSSLFFKVQRKEPELVCPTKATPREVKYLSDIDDQEGLRTHSYVVHVCKGREGNEGKDIVEVIRNALAETLVSFYPLAGRLRERADRKLMVDCTAEGVLFIEADADVSLDMFGDAIHPPFPCFDQLLYDVPGSSSLLNSPLLLIQVTRLMCGGFIFASRSHHIMSDGYGLTFFLRSLAEIARGATVPSVEPVWDRQLLNARQPPHISCIHREFDQVTETEIPLTDIIEQSFFFGAKEASALRNQLPPHLGKYSLFEILTACLWRCRTAALKVEPSEEVRILLSIDARRKFNPPIPAGYYGNVIVCPAAVSTAGELCSNPLEYAVQLVIKAKMVVTQEYMRSVADLMVVKGRPPVAWVRAFLVSDLSRVGANNLDFGWGDVAYTGPGKGGIDSLTGLASFYIPVRRKNGEEGLMVPICLPRTAMERFVVELETMMCASPSSKKSHSLISRV